MQFLHLFALAGAAMALAMPAQPDQLLQERQSTYTCSGTYSSLQCCAVDVLGVADLNCETPPTTPTDLADFESICVADGGKEARCCLLPILGQDILCEDPS